MNTITVTGTSQRNIRTTITEVTLSITQRRPTAPMAQRALAQSSSRLIAYLRRQPVSSLRTRGITLSATFNFSTTPPTVIDYQGTNTISFSTSISNTGTILDGAIRNGATRINRVSFNAASTAIKRARMLALRDAVRTAKIEAKTVALAAGKRLGPSLNVEINDSLFVSPIRSQQFREGSRFSQSGSATPVIGGDLSINARVKIVFDSF